MTVKKTVEIHFLKKKNQSDSMKKCALVIMSMGSCYCCHFVFMKLNPIKLFLDLDSGHETDEEVTMSAVHEEIQQLMDRHRINKWASKIVNRKYAFELEDVPADSQYLKIVYSFQCKNS